MELSTKATVNTEAQTRATSIDLATVISIAVVVCLLDSVIHEALGHGLMAVLLGLHPRQVSTTYLDINLAGEPAWKGRLVAAAGSGAEFLAAAICFVLLRFVSTNKANLRLFLWLLVYCNLFAVGGYLMVPTLLGYGDWAEFIQGLPAPSLWTAGLVLLGLLLSCAGVFLGVRSLDDFAGRATSGPVSRRRRRVTLVLASYLTIGIVDTAAAFLNPLDPALVLMSAAAATFGGNAFMLFMLSFGHKPSSTTPEHPITPVRSWTWLCLGLLSLIVEVFILAPGLPR